MIQLSKWKFDIMSSLLTIFVLPLLFFLRKIIMKYLKEWGSYIVDGLLYKLSRLIKRSFSWALTLKRYCRIQLGNERYKYLHVPSRTEVALEIDRVFVPLTLECQGKEKNHYNHDDILTIGNRIRIIGDPGSGKSSLIKRLFLDSCKSAISRPLKHKLPIIIELKNLEPPSKKNLGTWLYEYLRSEVEKSDVYQMRECFDNYIKGSGVLILLDGLDEVSTKNYPQINLAINLLSEKIGKLSETNTIIISMRTQFHQQIKNDFRQNFPQTAFLKSFSPSDIYIFLSRWPFPNKTEENISRIYKELTDRPTLREMCSNPLVLSMYVAEDQAAGRVAPPDSRTEFYQKVTEELILKRRLKQTGLTVAHTTLREQREKILGRLAYEHLMNENQPTNLLKWEDALNITKAIMLCDNVEAASKFREIAKETGLVTEEKPEETIRFIHLTFCEFLAAYEAVQGEINGWSKLMKVHAKFQRSNELQVRSRLDEVIPFACGLLPRKDRLNALDDIAAAKNYRLMARSFLETKRYDHPSWSILTSDFSKILLDTPEREWDQTWLRDVHLFSVVVRDANLCAIHNPQVKSRYNLEAFFQSLMTKQRDSLSTLLNAYAAQDAAAAFRLAELCKLDIINEFPQIIISNCDQLPFFGLIKDQMLKDQERIGLWASLLSEAGLRSSAVANMMHKIDPISDLDKQLSMIPSNKLWFGYLFIRKSFFTQCLSIATFQETNLLKFPSMLESLRNLRAVGAYKLENRLINLTMGMMLLFAIIGAIFNNAIFLKLSLIQDKVTPLYGLPIILLLGSYTAITLHSVFHFFAFSFPLFIIKSP